MHLQALDSYSPWDGFTKSCWRMPRGSSNVTNNPEPLQATSGYLCGGAMPSSASLLQLISSPRNASVVSVPKAVAGMRGRTRLGQGPLLPSWAVCTSASKLKKTLFSKLAVEKALILNNHHQNTSTTVSTNCKPLLVRLMG